MIPLTTERIRPERAQLQQIAAAFHAMVRDIQAVEGILINEIEDGILLSTVVNNIELDDRREIHRRELGFMRQWRHVGFDFYVMDRRDKNLCNMVTLEKADVYLRV